METLEPRILLTNEIISPGGLGFAALLSRQLVMDSTDSLIIELGGTTAGTQYDQVRVGDSAKFDGSLTVKLLGGYDPAIGTTFDVVTSTGSTGAFAQLDVQNLPNGKRLVPVHSPAGLKLVVADPARPAGGSQLRVADAAGVIQISTFFNGTSAAVSLSGVDVNVLGQSIRGNFQFGVGLRADNSPVVTTSASNVSASLGNGIVDLQNGSGSFLFGSFGVAGSASVGLSLLSGLPVTFGGSFKLDLNTSGVTINETINSARLTN